jgi:RNA ligase (TIGR02306 family)
MPLASIQKITSIHHHPGADQLDIAQVQNYECIVRRDAWKAGDLCVFIEPDSVLPQVPWSVMYRSKSNRVKAIRLRGEWSFGIIESFSILGENTVNDTNRWALIEGVDVTDHLGVTKYVVPEPQDLSAAGPYGFGIPRTDETKWNSVRDIPWGEPCDVTLKIDGQSWSAISAFGQVAEDGFLGIGGRSFLYQLDTINNYTRNEQQYQVLKKLDAFVRAKGVSLCIRGESYGVGIQKGAHNPHAKLPLALAFYSAWLIDERRYARKGDPFYIFDIASQMDLPTVPVIEKDVILTRELIEKYAKGIDQVNGQPFEGVVINHARGSFKVLNLPYDASKK